MIVSRPEHLTPTEHADTLHQQASGVVRLIDRESWAGARVATLTGTGRRARRVVLAWLAAQLASRGFVLVDPNDRTNAVLARGRGRHVAAIVTDDAAAVAATGWLVPLTRASPRGHLIVDARPRRLAWREPPEPVMYPGEPDWMLERAESWVADGFFERAEAVLSPYWCRAALVGRAPPWPAVRARVWMRFWQGRFEEARRALFSAGPDASSSFATSLARLLDWAEGLAPFRRVPRAGLASSRVRGRRRESSAAGSRLTHWLRVLWSTQLAIEHDAFGSAGRLLGSVSWDAAPRMLKMAALQLEMCLNQACARHARSNGGADAVPHRRMTGAPGLRRWGMEAQMWLLYAIPDLLTLVGGEDDEGRVLVGGCRWGAAHAAAEVAFVDAAHGTVVAAQPPGLPGLTPHERSLIVRRDRADSTRRPDGVVVTSPVRYAGALIGQVVCVGAEERSGTMLEAAGHLAALCAPALRARLDVLETRGQCDTRLPEILGRSPAMTALREAVLRAARSSFPVVIEGESGSGKELVARAIHRSSARRDRRFAAINCAALADDLAETELFGHARGAFTGAVGSRTGLFEEAHLGTLFLDEVAELSLRSQAKLLRAVQEREVRRLGENASRPVDVRLVSATNRSLRRMAAGGEFREDLLFRLSVVRINVPPLRERAEDITLLAVNAWKQLTRDLPTRAWLGPDALARLAQHPWPGNVRELQNVMAAVAVNAPLRGRVSARQVDRVLEESGGTTRIAVESLTDARTTVERRMVAGALARHGGRMTKAARELGLSRQGLAKAIKRLQLDRSGPAESVA